MNLLFTIVNGRQITEARNDEHRSKFTHDKSN